VRRWSVVMTRRLLVRCDKPRPAALPSQNWRAGALTRRSPCFLKNAQRKTPPRAKILWRGSRPPGCPGGSSLGGRRSNAPGDYAFRSQFTRSRHGAWGAHATHALPDLCLGIVFGASRELRRSSSLLKKVCEVSRWATLIQDPSARRTKYSQPSGFGFEYCASHVRFRVFQQTARLLHVGMNSKPRHVRGFSLSLRVVERPKKKPRRTTGLKGIIMHGATRVTQSRPHALIFASHHVRIGAGT
jgi:hypothetical protein